SSSGRLFRPFINNSNHFTHKGAFTLLGAALEIVLSEAMTLTMFRPGKALLEDRSLIEIKKDTRLKGKCCLALGGMMIKQEKPLPQYFKVDLISKESHGRIRKKGLARIPDLTAITCLETHSLPSISGSAPPDYRRGAT
ncbi:MAG: hypothetical protein WCG36_08045, partial [bacterium]